MRVHFARYLRPQTFQEVVGQELVLRMLKNMLCRQAVFPSYMFAGLRGTGKTTVARLFAAALNCDRLERFVAEPRDTVLPCAQCDNCRAIVNRDHPDVHEIDAASHTGVDAIRSVLEHVPFLPVQGRKKVYLIDEAHMLSKAAFNACLKIFEEPPEHVVFILATTDPHKIVDTVLSRCFHLYFDPLSLQEVAEYLLKIARQEHMSCDADAAYEIARITQGSMREALTLLERVSLIDSPVTRDVVLSVIGGVTQQELDDMIQAACAGDYERVCGSMQRRHLDGRFLWQGFKYYFQGVFRQALASKDQRDVQRASACVRKLCEDEGRWARTRDPQELAYYMIDVAFTFQGDPVIVSKSDSVLPHRAIPEPRRQEKPQEQSASRRVDLLKKLYAQQEPFVAAALSHAQIVEKENALFITLGSEHTFIKDWIEQAVMRCAQQLGTQLGEPAIPCHVQWRTACVREEVPGVVARAPHARSLDRSLDKSSVGDQGVPDEVNRLLKLFPGTVKREG